jgi:Uma2 family endonuclease
MSRSVAGVMNDVPKPLETGLRMSRSEYRAWAEAQPRGRFERVDGEIVAMAPERAVRARRKGDVYSALRQAIRTAGLRCEIYPDGMTIEVGESDYEPDAVVRCGDRLDGDRVDVPDPLVIVEVLSPSTRQVDLTRKLAAYFQVASLRHYLVFWADEAKVIHHHRRDGSETIETRILTTGEIRLDPPGISVSIEDIYAA